MALRFGLRAWLLKWICRRRAAQLTRYDRAAPPGQRRRSARPRHGELAPVPSLAAAAKIRWCAPSPQAARGPRARGLAGECPAPARSVAAIKSKHCLDQFRVAPSIVRKPRNRGRGSCASCRVERASPAPVLPAAGGNRIRSRDRRQRKLLRRNSLPSRSPPHALCRVFGSPWMHYTSVAARIIVPWD